jgi:hypothetical protein
MVKKVMPEKEETKHSTAKTDKTRGDINKTTIKSPGKTAKKGHLIKETGLSRRWHLMKKK